MQRSANNACLAEAKSWMNSAVSSFAIDGASATFPSTAGTACKITAAPTVTPPTNQGDDPTGTPISAWSDFNGNLEFGPASRGSKSEWKTVVCDTAKCKPSIKPA